MQELNILELSIFSILGIFLLGGAIAMVTNKQTVFSAFGFLVSMIALAGLFAMLDSQFLAIAQVMVSVGAVVILSMLTILTINAQDKALPDEKNKYKWLFFSTLVVSPITVLLYKILISIPQSFTEIRTIDTKVMGQALFTNWVFPFEILSILLLTAMVGAIVIARKKLPQELS